MGYNSAQVFQFFLNLRFQSCVTLAQFPGLFCEKTDILNLRGSPRDLKRIWGDLLAKTRKTPNPNQKILFFSSPRFLDNGLCTFSATMFDLCQRRLQGWERNE